MKGLEAKPELIFFVMVLIVILVLIVGSGYFQGWFKQ